MYMYEGPECKPLRLLPSENNPHHLTWITQGVYLNISQYLASSLHHGPFISEISDLYIKHGI